MKRTETVNTFGDGMVLDLNPISTPNNVLTNCLNGTLITFNGNEGVLQNDMGNGRVETAFLPEGYIPLGTTQLGGIIYIVSYNPLIDKCQIGSFPSPERNITTDELNKANEDDENNIQDFSINVSKFFEGDLIKSPYQKLILFNKVLHPGDKFQIYCKDLAISENTSILSAYGGNNANKLPRYLKFNVVAIQDNGQITNLNDTLVWNKNYYISDQEITKTNNKLSLDEYRDLVSSNYNVFNSKVDGKLAILAELECINSFDVSWDAKKNKDGNWDFYFFLNWTYDNDISKDKINLYSIRVDTNVKPNPEEIILEDYPNKNKFTNTDILYISKDGITNQDNTFYTPYYVTDIDSKPTYNEKDKEGKVNGDIITPRKNDGTDNQFLLYNPITIENPAENASKIVDFTIYPGMPFGYLDYLKQTFSVDLSKLGSGKIDLKEYRYWYDNNTNNITLNWALDAYPERGKSIKSVSFNTIEFDQNILDWLNSSNNGTKVDTKCAIKKINEQFKWENEENTAKDFNNLNPHPTSSKSSYSGHFTETITDLDANKLYLLCIDIDYNGEKTIRYYRFLYTSDIFNSKYFKTNDFSEIILDKQLEVNYSSTINLTNQNNIETLLDSNEQKVNTIPAQLEESKSNITYTIQNKYEYNVEIKPNSRSNSEAVKVSITEYKNPEIKPITATNTGKAQSLDSSKVSSSAELQKIDITSELSLLPNNSNKGIFKQTIRTPLSINYLNLESISIPYELQELSILTQWLLVWGRSTAIELYIADTYRDTTGNNDDNRNSYGDDHREYGELYKYDKIYKYIQEKLKSFDIVVLRFATHHSSKTGNEGNYTYWGCGERQGRKSAYFTQSIQYPADNQNTNVSLPIYAISDGNSVKLFTFSKIYNPYIATTSWYNSNTIKGVNSKNRFSSSQPTPVGLNINTNDSVFEAPFKKYYKLVNSTASKQVYSWNKISYYDNYTWTAPIQVKYEGTIKITINTIDISSSEKLPKNLQYTSNRPITIIGSITNRENFDKYLDMIIYNKSTQVLVKSGNNIITIDSPSPQNLYDNKGNKILYLMKDRGDTSAELSSLNTSNHAIKIVNNRLTVETAGVYSNENLKVMGRQEEQHIAISGIIKL